MCFKYKENLYKQSAFYKNTIINNYRDKITPENHCLLSGVIIISKTCIFI